MLLPFIRLFVITSFLLARKATCVDPQFLACNPKTCGDGQDITFPFFIQDEQEPFCGHPGFNLICKNGHPVLKLQDNEYTILHISYKTQTVRVSNEAVFDTTATCIPPFSNTSLPEDRFSLISNQTNLFLLYGCNSTLLGNRNSELLKYQVDCPMESGTGLTLSMFEEDPLLGNASDICENEVKVPVDGHRENSSSNVGVDRMLDNGFVLNWIASNCSMCEDGGGKCGFDDATYHFKCFCPDRPHALICKPGNSSSNVGVDRMLDNGFVLNWIASNCSMCEDSGGKCGFDDATYHFKCFCPDLPHAWSCKRDNPNKKVKTIVIAIAASAAGIGILIILFCYFRRGILSDSFIFCWKKKSRDFQSIEAFLRSHGPLALKRYKYYEVKKIAESFKDKLGQGGYGGVYKGKLADGCHVAVKVLKESNSNGEEFINEVASISRTSHVNIVTLLGFCFEGSKRALIYEFMSNGSLDKYIHKDSPFKSSHQLNWGRLYEIAVGIARGLEYLHGGCKTRILHFDIKPHNILLDENWCPKISDFGLAKICLKRESIISMLDARGTIGYIAPEVFCRNFGGVSHKSDVYSYGMLLVEMVGGRKNVCVEDDESSEMYFPDWIYKRLEVGEEELGLGGINNEEEKEIARKLILVSLWCIQTDPSNRPPMGRVVEMLQESLVSLPIPPKPCMSSPSRSFLQSAVDSSTTSAITG